MKKAIIFNLFIIFCITSGCAVAPKTSSRDMSDKRADKREEVIRAKLLSQAGQTASSDDQMKLDRARAERLDRARDRRGNAQRPGPGVSTESATQKPTAADDINPAQTSDDATFGFTKENPVKLGSSSGEIRQHVTSSYVYIKQLRDKTRMPFKYVRIGNVGPGEDMHIVDLYKLTDSSGTDFNIYIDMYHPDSNPLDCKAPKGMFIAQ